jgi:hypothetical protein
MVVENRLGSSPASFGLTGKMHESRTESKESGVASSNPCVCIVQHIEQQLFALFLFSSVSRHQSRDSIAVVLTLGFIVRKLRGFVSFHHVSQYLTHRSAAINTRLGSRRRTE